MGIKAGAETDRIDSLIRGHRFQFRSHNAQE
jgi:hypothetical protein